MLRLIPGWAQLCEQSSRRRAKKVRLPRDRRARRAAFEELECRRLLAADFTGVATNLQSALEVVQSQVTVALDAAQTGSQSHIPIVGDKLGQAAQFVSKFNDGLTQAIHDLNQITNPTDTQIKQAILNTPFIADRSGNGSVGIEDVVLTHLANFGSGGTEIEFTLLASATPVNQSLNFDTGLPGLPVKISTTGALDLSVGFAYEVAFKYNDANTVALDSNVRLPNTITAPDGNHPYVSGNHPLALFITAALSSNFHADARFGFIEGTATLVPSMPNGLYVTALVSDLTTSPTVAIDGTAGANLHLAGSFAGTDNDFPGISTDFHLNWTLSSTSGVSPPTVSFDNVALDLGKFVTNIVKPFFQDVQQATNGLKPVLDILGYPLPGLSDMSHLLGGGDITLLTLAGAGSELTGNGPLFDLVQKAIEIVKLIDNTTLQNDNISMPLGGFDLDGNDLLSASPALDISDLDAADLTNLSPSAVHKAALGLTDFVHSLGLGDAVNSLFDSMTAGKTNGFDIEFPILDHPEQVVFSMILGQDADMFSLEADADITSHAESASGLSIFGMPIIYSGDVHFQTHFKIAYDTYGLRELINGLANGHLSAGNVFSDVTDGFYISDDSYFNLSGDIKAGAGLSLGIFDFDVSGDVGTGDFGTTPVSITFDTTPTGKVRFANVDSTIHRTGELDADLGIEVDIGKEILGHFFGVRKRFNLDHEVLIYFGSNDPPILASQPDANGNVLLYLGENATLRHGYGLDNPVDGDESFIVRHLATNLDGSENIKVYAFGVSEEIDNVRSISAFDNLGNLTITVTPGVTSNVHFVGGQGSANLTYMGSGTAELYAGALASVLTGGSGMNVLVGGPMDDEITGGSSSNELDGGDGNDTITLGSGSNNVSGGSGHNIIIIPTPILQNATVVGGTNPNNSLQILGSTDTVAISAEPSNGAIDVGIQNTFANPVVHVIVSAIGDVFINGQDSATNFTIGDLSAVGVHQLSMSIVASFTTARTIDLDTRINDQASSVGIHDLLNQYDDPQHPGQTITEHGATIVNSTTGLTTQLLGFAGDDTLTFHHHGGSIAVDALGFTSGNFVFDTAERSPGQADSITITTPSRDNGITLAMTSSGNDVLITTMSYTSFRVEGDTTLDSLDLEVSAATSGANTLTFDASTVKGAFTVHALADATAIDRMTLSQVGQLTVASIFGQASTTDLLLATGQLALIEHDVTVSNVQLKINNSSEAAGGYFELTASTFGNWLIPALGIAPRLNFSGLRSDMEIFAAAGDRFQLDITPPSITSLTIHNASKVVQDLVYTANWAVPLALIGNFAFFAGQTLSSDGTVNRIKRLINVHSAVTLEFVGDAPSQVVLDGDADAPGAQYTLQKNTITNSTVGLSVAIKGYRSVDTLYVYMPGANMVADLPTTSIGQIYFDGQARLSGTNPAAPNTITIHGRYGSAQLTPLSTYNSLLANGNNVYLLGSMPQDSLAVDVPTNVLITAGMPTQLDLDQNPDAYATVTSSLYGSTLIGWKSGARPTDNGGFFVFPNVDDDQWSSVFAPGPGNGTPPNPFEDQPYGIEMPSTDSQLTVIYHTWENINGVRTLVDQVPIVGTARFWTVNPNPVAVDNNVQLNASQVRGTFNFNVTGPDYDYIRQLETGMFSATELSVSYTAPFYVWGNHYDDMRIAFGQSNITLTDVNPQLSVAINSGNKNYTYPGGSFQGSFPDNDSTVLRSPYPVTTLNVGNGTLASIQGNVSVQNMIVNVDDSAGTNANNLILTSTTLGTWTTTGGTTNPVLTIGSLDSRTFTVIAGTTDRLDIEAVPSTAGLTSIQTANNSTSPVDAYLMGRAQASHFQAVGNINLHIGDRLNANGSVTLAGQVSGTWATDSTSVPINYQYTGTNGHGLLVYDAANTSAGLAEMAIGPVTGDTTKQQLVFNNSKTSVIYGASTDVSYYEPVFGVSNIFNLIDNRLNGAVHYYANASGPFSRVNVQAAFGPVEVDGRGVNTDVEISPASFGVLGLGTSPVGNDLSTTILAPVTVTHATLAIRPDTLSTPAPSQPKNVVIGTSQITGIAGAAIQYSNLVDTVTFDTIPGLMVQMPRFAANLTVAGTLAGVTTGVSVIGQSMLSTQVTGTSGRLALGTFDENGTYFFVDGGQEFNYTTQSLTIGNGSVQNVHGDVLVGGTGHFSTLSGMVIDDRNDTAGRTATFNTTSLTNSNAPTLAGLASGNIAMRQVSGGLTVYSAAGSHWTLQGIDSLGPATMYAGVGTIVDLAGPPGNFSNSAVIPRWTVYGAGTVRLNPGAVPKVNSLQFPIIKADPARPADITQLIVDHTNVQAVFFDDNSVPSGVNNFIQVLDKSSDGLGRVSLGNSTDLQTEVEFAPTTTQLTVTGDHSNTPQINILDTVALSTTINPNFNQVNVLGTTAPLDITQSALRFSGDAANVILGNSNSMQALHGDITLDGSNATLPTMPAMLSFAADSTNHVVTFANPSSGHVDITGLAPAAIHVVGTLVAPSITAGSGNNTLVGGNAANSWIINAANGGTLNSLFKFAGFRNLTGGMGADTFRFTPAGSITGNLDGGPGIDSLTYDNLSTWHTLSYNLAQGIAPLVGGTASNLEIVPIDHGSGSNQTSFINDVVSYSPLSIFGGLGAFTYSATGLPTGLSIDAHTGAITGTIATQLSGDHAVHVSATDGYNSAATDFTWTIQTFSLINPGTIRSHAGDVVSLPIQVQGSAAGLTFSATSLPDGLSIDPATGLISGTLTPQAAEAESYGTIVSATDGGSVQSVSFVWLVPSFALQNPGDLTIPEGAPLHIPLLAYNLSGDSLAYDVDLSDNFYVDSQGILRGKFGFYGEPVSFDVTVMANDNYVTDSVEFTITTEPGFDISGNDDRRTSDGTPIDTQITVSSPYGDQLSVAVSGLPQGLTIDDNLHITGTISRSAVSSTPYHVTVAVTNETVGYTYDAGFDWTVIHVPTAAEINNGSPAGVPFLITTFDPDSFAALTQFQDVTYGSGATTHTVVYFVNGSNIWQYNGQQATQVKSIDPNNPTMPTSLYQYAALPGRGIIFSDDQTGHVWFADESGARVIYSGSLQFTTGINGSIVGNFGFVDAEQYDPSASAISNVVLQINFNTNSDPTVRSIFNSPYQIDYSNMMPFGGGLIFDAIAPANQAETLYWYDPASSQLHSLLSSTSIGSFGQFTIGNNGDNTQTLYFIENAFGFAILDTLNSSQLSAAHPTITMNESFNEVDNSTAYADGRLVVMETKPGSNGESVQLYLSNGGGGNTQPVGQPFNLGSYGSVSQPIVIGNDVYFVYMPSFDFNQITDSTITAQIWKLDVSTTSLSSVANFYGTGPVYYGFNYLTVGGGKLFFTMYVSTGNIGLFEFDPATGAAQVLGNPQNDFFNPYGLAYLNGALYFAANSQVLKDSSGDPSYQPWELGPAAPVNTLPGDFNGDGSVDAADFVVWQANNGTQADYNTWRGNFGRTLSSGSAEAISSVVQDASVPTSQTAVLAISSGSSATTSNDALASAPVVQELKSAAADTSQPAAIAVLNGNVSETSNDALASTAGAREVKSSAANTSQPAAVRLSLDEYFSQFPPVTLLRVNRSVGLSLSHIFNTDAELPESFLSDDLEQLRAEEFSLFIDTAETKSALEGCREADGVQRLYIDELFDDLAPLLVAPLSK